MTAVLTKETTILVENDNTTKVVKTDTLGTVVETPVNTTVAVESGGQVYSTQEETYYAVGGGIQGPPGIPGASTQFEYHLSGGSLGGNRAVTLNSVGQVVYPDLTNTNSFVLGLTTGSSSLGELAEVQIAGTQTEPSWSWIPGGAIFVGSNGTLSQEPPASGQVLVIGWAATPTKLVIEKQPPIYME